MVFERFTKDAKAMVTEAARAAGAAGAAEVDPLHVLTAVTTLPDSGAARVLGRLGVTLEDVTAQTERTRRRGGVSDADAAALGELGIDVDALVSRVERDHGPNALVGSGRPARGHVPFADASKRTLERTLREVISLGDRRIGSEHILLALAVQPGPAAGVLAALGVSADTIRSALRRAS
jgi:ATP-dependent Clp protease ATP-binding subunit ClpA